MKEWLTTDWHGLFVPEMSLPEVLIRGTAVYLALCLLLRVVLKRQAGKVGLSDLLVVALVAGVCRNPLVRDTKSIPDGLAVVAVVLAWSYALDWLSYHSRVVHRLLHPQPVPLIRDGALLPENLRTELMTESQLRCKLRKEGVKDVAEVQEAWMEGSGEVSVIKRGRVGERNGMPDGDRPGASSSPSVSGNGAVPHSGQAPPTDDLDAEVIAFVRAAERLRERLAWHQRSAAVLKELLARHGCRLRPAPGENDPGGANEPSGTSPPTCCGGQVAGSKARSLGLSGLPQVEDHA